MCESQLTKSASSVINSAVTNESPSLVFELNLNDDADECFCIIDIMANLFHLQTQAFNYESTSYYCLTPHSNKSNVFEYQSRSINITAEKTLQIKNRAEL